jgi:NTP pyrophosphatase (non-canonical NTP hydrolase)
MSLTFNQLRYVNVARCNRWHPEGIESWSPSDWLVAAMGELGELASEVKMFNRTRDGLIGNKEPLTPAQRTQRMAKEAADVVIYLDLFCAERGIDLGAALVRKFNEVSERNGFPERLGDEP